MAGEEAKGGRKEFEFPLESHGEPLGKRDTFGFAH